MSTPDEIRKCGFCLKNYVCTETSGHMKECCDICKDRHSRNKANKLRLEPWSQSYHNFYLDRKKSKEKIK